MFGRPQLLFLILLCSTAFASLAAFSVPSSENRPLPNLQDSSDAGDPAADPAGVYSMELLRSDGNAERMPAALTIAATQRSKLVPELVGLDLRIAEALLSTAGLKIGPITPVAHPQTPKNQVRGQQPPAGTLINEHGLVSLVISFPPDDDDDIDGLPDAWEYAKFGGLQQRGTDDMDGDGYSNYQEYQVGTAPADSADAPVPAGTFFEYDIFGRIIVKQITLEP
jgi:hypothetical protein